MLVDVWSCLYEFIMLAYVCSDTNEQLSPEFVYKYNSVSVQARPSISTCIHSMFNTLASLFNFVTLQLPQLFLLNFQV